MPAVPACGGRNNYERDTETVLMHGTLLVRGAPLGPQGLRKFHQSKLLGAAINAHVSSVARTALEMKVPVERDVAAQQQPLHLSMAALDEFLPPMPPRRPLPEPLMATSGRPRGGNGHRRDGRHGDAGAGDGRHGDAGAGDGAPPLDERADACALPPIASRALRTASLEERAAARAAARSPRGARERGPAPPARPAGSSGDAPGASLFVYDGPWGSKAAASLPLRRPLPIAAVAPPAPLLSPEAAAAAAAHAAAAYVTSTAALSSLGGSTVDAHAPGVPSRVPRLRLKRDGTLASALDAAALARWSASSRLAPESAMAPPPLGAPRSARDRAPLRGLRLASAEAAAGDAVRAAAAALGVGGVGVSPRVARDAAARVVLRVTDPRALPPGRRARPRLPARVAAEALGGPPRSLQPQPSVIAPGPWSYGEESAGALDGLRASAPVDGGGVNSALPQMSPLHSSRRLPRWWTAHGGAPTGQPASLHGGGGSLVLDRVIGSPPSPLRGAASLDAFSARGATPRQRSQRRARALWQLLRRRVIRPAAASRRFHNLAAARAAAEEHIASSGVVTELPHGADPSSVPARQQGNLLFYTTVRARVCCAVRVRTGRPPRS